MSGFEPRRATFVPLCMIRILLLMIWSSGFAEPEIEYNYYLDGKVYSRIEKASDYTSFEVYYENGELMCKGRRNTDPYYRKGQYFKSWFPNGKVQYDYIENEGYFFARDQDGRLTHQCMVSAEGRIYEEFYASGKVHTREYLSEASRVGVNYYCPLKFNAGPNKIHVYIYEKGWKKMEQFYPNGSLMKVGMAQGKEEAQKGIYYRYTYFTPDGDTDKSVTHYNDIITGRVVEYYVNGQMKTEKFYEGKEDIKLFRSWTENGVLTSELTMKNGRYEGPAKMWYPNGKPRMFTHYHYGMTGGPTISWYENGMPQRQENYHVKFIYSEKGKLDGLNVDFPFVNNHAINTELRKISELGDFDSGRLRIGKWTGYYPNGKLAYKAEFVNGIPDGDFSLYSTEGHQMVSAHFTDGRLSGKMKIHTPEGVLQLDCNYDSEKPVGERLEYDAKGQLQQRSIYPENGNSYTLYKKNYKGEMEIRSEIDSAAGTIRICHLNPKGETTHAYTYTMRFHLMFSEENYPEGMLHFKRWYNEQGKQSKTEEFDREGFVLHSYVH